MAKTKQKGKKVAGPAKKTTTTSEPKAKPTTSRSTKPTNKAKIVTKTKPSLNPLDLQSEHANQIKKDITTTGPVFHFFRKLPIEIRLKIWGLASPKPAIIRQAKPLSHAPLYTFVIPRPTPAVLQVCHDSRKEWLYHEGDDANDANNTSKEHKLFRWGFPTLEGKMTFFNFKKDCLFLYSFKLAERDIKYHLKYLMIYPPMKQPTIAPSPYFAYQLLNGFPACFYLPQHIFKTDKDLRWYDYNLNEVMNFPSVVELTVLINDLDTPARKKSKQRVEKCFLDHKAKNPGFRYPKLNFQEYTDLKGIKFGKN